MLSKLYHVDWKNIVKLGDKANQRKDGFVPYVEPFRPLNEVESTTIYRLEFSPWVDYPISKFLVSYEATAGGFTTCAILLDGKLYLGSSHCSKVDRWLPIRGKMLAFRRALEHSQGIGLDVPEVDKVIASEVP